jgi:hypothetical protein
MPRGLKGNSPLGLTAICRITPEKQLSKVLRFGDVLTNFVRLIGFAGISQQMLKLGSTSHSQCPFNTTKDRCFFSVLRRETLCTLENLP